MCNLCMHVARPLTLITDHRTGVHLQEREIFCLWGENDHMVSSDNSAHLREVVPHCTIHVIKHAGHEITVADMDHEPEVKESLHNHILQFCRGPPRRQSGASAGDRQNSAAPAADGGLGQPEGNASQ